MGLHPHTSQTHQEEATCHVEATCKSNMDITSGNLTEISRGEETERSANINPQLHCGTINQVRSVVVCLCFGQAAAS